MRIRATFLAVTLAVAGLSACSSSGTSGSGSGGGPSGVTTTGGGATGGGASTGGGSAGGGAALCARLRAAGGELTKLGGSINDPATAKAQLQRTIAVLKQIGTGAPSTVQNAVNDMINALESVGSIYTGSTPDYTKLAQLGPKLAADGQVIASYVENSCLQK